MKYDFENVTTIKFDNKKEQLTIWHGKGEKDTVPAKKLIVKDAKLMMENRMYFNNGRVSIDKETGEVACGD